MRFVMEQKNYLISGYYGYKNSGDDALLASVVKDIYEINPENKIIILSKKNTSYDFQNVKYVDRFSLFRVLKAIKKSDVIVMGGGSLLQDKTSNRSLYYYLGIIHFSNFYKKACYLYANGIGPINGNFNQKITKKILNKVKAISLRDEESFEFINSIGVNNPNIVITADSVFSLEYEYTSNKEREKKVAFVIRDWQNSENYSKEIAKFADYLNDEYNLKAVFVPLKLNDDEKIANKIIKLMKNESEMIILDEEKKLIDFFATCYFTVAMRYHAVIYSSLAGTIPIGLSYDKKVNSICKSLDTECINSEEISIDKLIKASRSIIDNYDAKKLAITNNVEILKEKSKINKEILKKI